MKIEDGQEMYHIKVTNIADNTVWEHRRVPISHVETLKMSPNLKVKVVKFVGRWFKRSNKISYNR
tara:strand:+ start:27180 stop:27374 length:195 start_codon:yes stop_codon:yes gene_type:complete